MVNRIFFAMLFCVFSTTIEAQTCCSGGIPLSNNAIPNKERVFALLNIDSNTSKVYQFNKFEFGEAVKQQFSGKDYIVVGTNEFIVGYELDGDLKNLTFTYEFNATDKVSVFSDNEGNKWSVAGVAVSGPRVGQKLKPTISVTSYWFAIAAFYPNPEIY